MASKAQYSSSSQSQWLSSSSSSTESSQSPHQSKRKPAHADVTQGVKDLQKQATAFAKQFESAAKSKKPIFNHLDTFAKLDLSARNIIQKSGTCALAQVAQPVVRPVMEFRLVMLALGLGVTKEENAGMFLIKLATALNANPKALEDEEIAKRLEDHFDRDLSEALRDVRNRLGELRGKRTEDTSLFSSSSPSFSTEESDDPLYDNNLSNAMKAQVLWEVGIAYDKLSDAESQRAAACAKLAQGVDDTAKKSLSKAKLAKASEGLEKFLFEEDSSAQGKKGASKKEVDSDTEDLLENLKRLKEGTRGSRKESGGIEEESSSASKGKKAASKKNVDSDTEDLLENLKRLNEGTRSSRKDSEDVEVSREEGPSSAQQYGKSAKTAKKGEVSGDDAEDLVASLRALKQGGSKVGSTKGELRGKVSKDARGLKETIRKLEAERGRIEIELVKLDKKIAPLAKKLEVVGVKLNELPTEVGSTNIYKKAKIVGEPTQILQEFIQLMNKGKALNEKLSGVKAELEEARSKLESTQPERRDLSELEHKPLERRHSRLAREAVEQVQKRGEELASKIENVTQEKEQAQKALASAKGELGYYVEAEGINDTARRDAFRRLSELRQLAEKAASDLVTLGRTKPTDANALVAWNEKHEEASEVDKNAKQQVVGATQEYSKAVKAHTDSAEKSKQVKAEIAKIERQLLAIERELGVLKDQYGAAQKKIASLSGQASGETQEAEALPRLDFDELEHSKGTEFRPLIELMKLCYKPTFYKERNQGEQLYNLFSKISEKHQALIGKSLLQRANQRNKEGSDHMDDWMQQHIADNIIALVKACEACFRSK